MMTLLHITADGIAFDWTANKLYFTDEILDIVGVVDFAASNATILIRTGINTRPRAIVLDPSAGYDRGTARLLRNLFGGGETPS
jgi:hypothetical protein